MANYDLTYEGSRVQSILDTGDELRDAGYIFRGEATPSTAPGTPTERVAYIGGPGTYTNFGTSTEISAGCIGVFKYNGSAWSIQVINTGLSSAITAEAGARANADGLLQNAINAINAQIGNGYVYAGVATPSTEPVSGKVFYLAITAGTYTNFEDSEETPLAVTAGINILKNTGTGWVLDQIIAIDAEPTQGSDHLVKSGGVLNSIIQNGPAFDISAYNAQGGVLATYADLSAALTALNALPADFKKGGMSIKFVLSSDNKYVQYRLMADAWSINTEDWAIAYEGVYVENPEFVYVKVDNEGKILWAIKPDGKIYYGAGVPQQVIDYIETYGYDKTTIDELLNEKVDKEEGKSLIDAEYATGISCIENPEFLDVDTDKDGKILRGIKKNGNNYIPNIESNTIDELKNELEEYKDENLEHRVEVLEGRQIPSKTSQLTNDSGYVNSSQIPQPVSSVIQGNGSPVTSGAVYNAIQEAGIQAAQVTINTGLPFIAVASSEAPQAIKDVCQYVCDGVDDQDEINQAIQFIDQQGGGKIFLTHGRFFISSPIVFKGCSELCGEGAGCGFGEDPVLRTYSRGTQLQAVANTDIIRIERGRGCSIHDIYISGFGRRKANNDGWGIKIIGLQDVGNYYNLAIVDCCVAFGTICPTDVLTLHDCNIQRNKAALLFYNDNNGGSIYNNIICENFGITTYTGQFRDTSNISDSYIEKTFDINTAIALISCARFHIHHNSILRSGYVLNFEQDIQGRYENTDFYPISHIEIINWGMNIVISDNLFTHSNASAIRLSSYTDGERRIRVYNNSFGAFGFMYGNYKDSVDNSDERNECAIVLSANVCMSEIVNNNFYKDTQTGCKYAVYENDCQDPSSVVSYSLVIANNTMWNLHGADKPNRCRLVGTNINNFVRDNNIAQLF